MSLNGITVVITRPRPQAEESAELVRERGGVPLIVPLIAVKPPKSWTDLDACLTRLSSYRAVIVTSVNAVKSLSTRAARFPTGLRRLKEIPFIAVGRKTASAAERAGFDCALFPEVSTAVTLAARLLELYKSGTFLFPRGDIARGAIPEQLRAAGLQVDEPIVYRTARPAVGEMDGLRALIEHGGVDAITLASPSAVDSFVELLETSLSPGLPRRTIIGVIGPTTAARATDLGLTPHVSGKMSTFDSLLDGIQNQLDRRKQHGHGSNIRE